MIAFMLILIGLVLFYALFTNKTGPLLSALLTGQGSSTTPPTTPAPQLPTQGVA